MKETKKKIRSEIKKSKLRYRDKIEAELGSNNLRQAWHGMNTMTGLNHKVNSNIALSGYNSDKQLADELNNF